MPAGYPANHALDMTILDKIVETKRQEVEALRPNADALKRAATARTDFRDFVGAVSNRDRIALIAEVKKASPSAGVICSDFDPVRIARQFEQAGANALSVLTDERYFQGQIEFLQRIQQAVALPLLRKDFLMDELQVYQAAACGADAILLIVAMLDVVRLTALQSLARHLGMAVLVEVHDERELECALAVGANLIGINNRDLHDFSINLTTTERLAAGVPASALLVAESGIHTRTDVERVARAGARAILVGEALIRSGNIQQKINELLATDTH